MKSAPRQQSRRRLPTKNELMSRYHMHGTHPPSSADIQALETLDMGFKRMLGSPASSYYQAWLQYELGVAKLGEDPAASSRHLSTSIRIFETRPVQSPEDKIAALKNVSLITLLHARLDESERIHSLQHRATIRNLGNLVMSSANAANTTSDMRTRNGVWGELSEIAIAGVLLTTTRAGQTIVPAPASPRQNSPHRKSLIGHEQTLIGVHTIDSTDFNVHLYSNSAALPTSIMPVQVKTRLKADNDSGRYSNLVLYANHDLFVEQLHEYHQLGESLIAYGRQGETSRQLYVAQENILLAMDLFEEKSA